jgi:hypothetical protein
MGEITDGEAVYGRDGVIGVAENALLVQLGTEMVFNAFHQHLQKLQIRRNDEHHGIGEARDVPNDFRRRVHSTRQKAALR